MPPTIDDIDIDFDSMSDDELEKYLFDLREVSKTRKPRAGASAKISSKEPKAAKEPKAPKPKKLVLRIDPSEL